MNELPPLPIHPDPDLAELRREVAALQARVAALEAQVFPGGAITCSAITVVDAQKQPVAAIDATGLLQCQRLHVERPDSPTFLTFDPQMGNLVIVMKNTSGGPPVRMVILNDGG